MIEIVLWIFGIAFLLGTAFFVYVFGGMIFVDKLAEISVRWMKDFVLEDSSFGVVEQELDLPPIPYEFEPGSGDVSAAREILLTPENGLVEGERAYDSDPNRTVYLLESSDGNPDKVFHRNDVYAVGGERLGGLIYSFVGPSLQTLRYVGGLNQKWFLLEGDPEGSQFSDSKLWQVSHSDYSRKLLSDDPYFTFSRPPRIFRPAGFPGYVLVYYVDSVDYGFGGDCSRPKYSVVRLYSEQYSYGHDVVRFSFRAGTIVDVKYQGGALTLYGDPSRPGSSERRPPRVWKLRGV